MMVTRGGPRRLARALVLLGWLAAAPSVAETAHETAARRPVVDVHHGVPVADPYRWLEETESPETLAWAREQDRRTREALDTVGLGPAIARRVGELDALADRSVPVRAGDRLYFLELDPESGQNRLVAESADGAAAVPLVVPGGPGAPAGFALGNLAPAPDGEHLLYEVWRDGTGERRLRVVRTAAPAKAVVEVPGATTSERPWLADGSGFVFVEPTREGASRVMIQRLQATTTGAARELYRTDDPDRRLRPRVSDDGRWAVVEEAGEGGAAVVLVDLLRPSRVPVVLAAGEDASLTFVGTHGYRVWLQTSVGAPRGRVVSVDPAAPEPERWTELVPEGTATLERALAAGGRLLVERLREARPAIEIWDAEGRKLFDVETPFGLIWTDYLRYWPGWTGHQAERFAYFRSLNPVAPGVYRIDVETGSVQPWMLRGTGADPDAFVLEQHTYTSRDGTRVPLVRVRGRSSVADRSPPTLIWAYGAWGFTPVPFFNAKFLTFLEHGGSLVIPYLRGGGVHGEAWHRAGVRENKQNTVDDLVAAAEYLVREGLAEPDRLAVEGQGPGGTAAAAAVIQRPDLWGAAVLDAPITDLVRDVQLVPWRRSELGSVDDPEAFRDLLAVSPYHNVRPDRTYPPVLIRTGSRDRTVAPWHAYKLAAALQAGRSEPAAWLRVAWDEGHGFTQAAGGRVAAWSDDLAFVARWLGLDPLPAPKETMPIESRRR